ncbi:MAG: N-acetylmuramoyl-L-alanine amidase [Chloroflexi bacterium]|nr:N-acetylmuramoyl-L-alanine amidase [Chloroflexota bacterium]
MDKKFNNNNIFRFILTFFVILISLSIIFVGFADKKLMAGDAITIFLDPGHGGSDYGCVHNGLIEKEINLKIALKLKGLLESNGFRVIMRRTSNEGKSLDEIANMANNSGADLFLSIHNNASLSPASTGTETYWSANGVSGSSQFAASIQSSLVSEIGRPNRGVKTADFKVIKNTDITAALVECVFLSNPDEANLLKDDGFLNKIVNGLFNGISNYARNITPGNSTAGGSNSAADGSNSTASGTYKATKVLVNIDEPKNSQTIGGNFELKGWAVEKSGVNSPEITAVHVYDGPAAGAKNIVGIATYGIARLDVAQYYGKANFTNCGFTLGVDSSRLAKGTHVLYVYAHNEQLGWAYTTVKVNILNDGSNVGNQDNSISTPVQGTVETNTTNTTNNSTSNQNYNSSGTQKVLINIDSLKNNQQVSGDFELAGWAVEQSAMDSTGITAMHVYDGPANGEQNMLGVATYGIPRKDVADYFGKNNLTNCGFSLTIDSTKLKEGSHTLYIYAYNPNLGWKYVTVAINYNGSSNTSNNNQSTTSSSTTNTSTNTNTSYASSGQPKALINVDLPSPKQQLSGDFELAGWAVEQSAMDSTGITAIHVYDGPANGEQNMLGVAQYGIVRSDVASNFGKANFTNCGFKLIVNSSKLTNGKHTLYVYAYNPNLGWKYVTVAINYAGSTSSGSTSSVSGGTVITNSTNIVGYIDVTVDQLVSIFINRGSAKVEWAKRLAPIYIQYGKLFNIRADIAWAQMCHETGFLEYTGDVKPNQNNFCGMGATGGGVPGNSFTTEELGIIAHYAHLAWYVYPSHINGYCSKTYDPRHSDSHYFNGNSTIGTLNARWAPGVTYTDKILLFANQIYGN